VHAARKTSRSAFVVLDGNCCGSGHVVKSAGRKELIHFWDVERRISMQSEPVFVATEILAVICVAVWVYLLGARGRYWLGSIKDTARNTKRPRRRT
jgi:hypothetical protein